MDDERSRGEVAIGAADGPLPGGTANHGRVVKVGNAVRRPAGPHSPAVHALLSHLARAGFTHSPQVVGFVGDTELLTYMNGSAAIDPIPDWALTSAALASVGELLAKFHHATESFDATGWSWQRPVPPRWRGGIIAHNDANPANIIFRGGVATALIDFDLAAPGSRAWDLAVTACFWVPFLDPDDVTDSRHGRTWLRFRELLDGYGADAELRGDVAEACVEANRWIASIIERASVRGHPAFGRVWAEKGAMYRRAHRWLVAHSMTIEHSARSVS